MINTHAHKARTFRTLTDQLTAVGVTLPAEVTEALTTLAEIEARRPASPGLPELADAYLTGATDKHIDALATTHATHKAKDAAWQQAVGNAGKNVAAAITANGDSIVASLRDLAEPLIEQVTTVGKLNTTDVATLVRAGHTDHAEAAARLETHAGHLANLYRLRDQVTKGADYGHEYGYDCSAWTDPRPVTKANAGRTAPNSPGELFVRGIKAGGELWFPTPDEAWTAARQYADEARRASDNQKVEAAKGGASFF